MSAIHAPMFTGEDPYWSYVTTLLHFNTDYTDLKGHTFTPGGNASISSAQKKFGAGALYADYYESGHIGPHYISTPYSADLSFPSGDFTIEGWIYPTDTLFAICGAFDNPSGWRFYLNVKVLHLQSNSGSDKSYDFSALSNPLNRWVYVKAVKIGSQFFLQMDDTSSGDLGAFGSLTSPGSAPFYIGYVSYGNWSAAGYIDEFRITKGIGRPITTMPTKEFPNS